MKAGLLCLLALMAIPSHAQDRRVTDATGRALPVPAKVAKVYAAGPPAGLLVLAIAPDKLAGWTRAFRPDEAAFLPKRYAELPELGRLTGRGNTANVEVVLKVKPELILDVGSTSPTYVSLAERVTEQTGIPYALFDGRLDATVATIRSVGRLLGEEARAKALADWYESELADLKARVAKVPAASRPRAYYGRGPAGLQTGLAGSINAEALEFLGARNVAAETKGGLAGVSLEQLLAWDPEVIFTTDPNFFAAIWKDSRWQGVSAVRARRVHLAPHLPFGWFDFPPGPNRLPGLWWAGMLMYPEAFKGVDLRAKVSAFYSRFYLQAPSAAQMDALLGEPGVLPPGAVSK